MQYLAGYHPQPEAYPPKIGSRAESCEVKART